MTVTIPLSVWFSFVCVFSMLITSCSFLQRREQWDVLLTCNMLQNFPGLFPAFPKTVSDLEEARSQATWWLAEPLVANSWLEKQAEIHMAWVLARYEPALCTAPFVQQVVVQLRFAFQAGEMSKWLMNLWTVTLILGRVSLVSTSNHCILSNVWFPRWRMTLPGFCSAHEHFLLDLQMGKGIYISLTFPQKHLRVLSTGLHLFIQKSSAPLRGWIRCLATSTCWSSWLWMLLMCSRCSLMYIHGFAFTQMAEE